MKKFILNVFIILYFIIAIAVTVCLLAYNDYKVTELGGYAFILSTDEELDDISQKGDLIIVKKAKNKEINIGDKIFFYTQENKETVICAAKVESKDNGFSNAYNFTVEGDYRLAQKHVIGKVDTATKIPYLGTMLKILESRLVFLFLVVFPSFIVFLYEGYKVIMEIKYGKFEDME